MSFSNTSHSVSLTEMKRKQQTKWVQEIPSVYLCHPSSLGRTETFMSLQAGWEETPVHWLNPPICDKYEHCIIHHQSLFILSGGGGGGGGDWEKHFLHFIFIHGPFYLKNTQTWKNHQKWPVLFMFSLLADRKLTDFIKQKVSEIYTWRHLKAQVCMWINQELNFNMTNHV